MGGPGAEMERRGAGAALPDKISYAKALADSGLLPSQYRRQPANLLYAIEYGEMLDLPPMAAITGIHVIDGKPTASAGLISALVRRAGHKLRVTGDDQGAVAEIVRRDDPRFTFRAEWTVDRARQAGLLDKKGDTWQRYPAAMLKARAVTEVARDACEEALSGMRYTPEELGVEVDEVGVPARAVVGGDAEPARGRTASPPRAEDDDPWYVRTAVEAGALTAQDIAVEAADVAVTVDLVRTLWYRAQEHGLLDADVTHPDTGEETPLKDYLTERARAAAEDATHEEHQDAADSATGGEQR